MAKISIEDSEKESKESVEASVTLREGGYRAKVNIHMGTCGIASGARQTHDRGHGRDRQAGRQGRHRDHLGMCRPLQPGTHDHRGTPRGAAPVKYVDLNADKMREIFAEHVLGGKPVEKIRPGRGK